jgi:hypothetical protein
MYAIRNKRTKRWLYGTDYRRCPPTQRTSHNEAITFEDWIDAEHQFRMRKCGKEYEIVKVKLIIDET